MSQHTHTHVHTHTYLYLYLTCFTTDRTGNMVPIHGVSQQEAQDPLDGESIYSIHYYRRQQQAASK